MFQELYFLGCCFYYLSFSVVGKKCKCRGISAAFLSSRRKPPGEREDVEGTEHTNCSIKFVKEAEAERHGLELKGSIIHIYTHSFIAFLYGEATNMTQILEGSQMQQEREAKVGVHSSNNSL